MKKQVALLFLTTMLISTQSVYSQEKERNYVVIGSEQKVKIEQEDNDEKITIPDTQPARRLWLDFFQGYNQLNDFTSLVEWENTNETAIVSNYNILSSNTTIEGVSVPQGNLGIESLYNIDFSNNNALIDLNFKVEGFSLIFSGNAKFNSKLTIKDNKIYFSELNYKSFNLIDKVEENELSDVFIKKYSEFIKNKTMEGLTITLKRKPIYYFNNDNNFINDFKLNESHLVINTSIYNKDYKTYYIICFIFSFLLLLISFLFNNNKTKRIRNE